MTYLKSLVSYGPMGEKSPHVYDITANWVRITSPQSGLVIIGPCQPRAVGRDSNQERLMLEMKPLPSPP